MPWYNTQIHAMFSFEPADNDTLAESDISTSRLWKIQVVRDISTSRLWKIHIIKHINKSTMIYRNSQTCQQAGYETSTLPDNINRPNIKHPYSRKILNWNLMSTLKRNYFLKNGSHWTVFLRLHKCHKFLIVLPT